MATPVRRTPAAPVTPATPARPTGFRQPPAAPARAPAPAPVSMYAGVQAIQTRPDVMPEQCVLECTLSAYYDDPPINDKGQLVGDPWGKFYLVIDAIEKAGPGLTQRVGDQIAVLINLSPRAHGMGQSRVKRAALALAGYDGTFDGYDERAYDEADPFGMIIDATAGRENIASGAGISLIGRRARVVSKRGKPRKEGDGYYVEYEWSALDDAPIDIPAPLTPENWEG